MTQQDKPVPPRGTAVNGMVADGKGGLLTVAEYRRQERDNAKLKEWRDRANGDGRGGAEL